MRRRANAIRAADSYDVREMLRVMEAAASFAAVFAMGADASVIPFGADGETLYVWVTQPIGSITLTAAVA